MDSFSLDPLLLLLNPLSLFGSEEGERKKEKGEEDDGKREDEEIPTVRSPVVSALYIHLD